MQTEHVHVRLEKYMVLRQHLTVQQQEIFTIKIYVSDINTELTNVITMHTRNSLRSTAFVFFSVN